MIPPTPTPLIVGTPTFTRPVINFWQFVPSALQVWNTAHDYTVVFQAIVLLAIIILGIVLVLSRLRALSGQSQSDSQ